MKTKERANKMKMKKKDRTNLNVQQKKKPKNRFKLKGEKGSLLDRLKPNKKKIVISKQTKDDESNEVKHQLIIVKEPVVLKKKLSHLSKSTIKKYDLIISVSYENQTLDAEKVLDLIKEACKDRLKEIDYLEDSVDLQKLRYGLLFDVKQLDNCLIKGPDGDSDEASEFRNFWGERSELRRFEDGTIKEAVYFSATLPKQRRRVIFKIINYILNHHLGLKRHEISCEGLILEDYISTNISISKEAVNPKSTSNDSRKAIFNIGTGEQFYQPINRAKDNLEKLIKNLDLKLKVIEFKCQSSIFRGTEVCIQPPLLNKVQVEHIRKKLNSIKPIELILNVNADSSMWPQKLQPLRSIKLGFYIELYDKLKEQNLANLDAKLTNDFIDIFYDNFLFRLRLYVPKELTLLQNSVYQNGKLNRSNLRESIIIERELDIMPKINTILQTLNTKDSNFGLACRLAKKWISTNYLNNLNETAVEMIMFYVYQQNQEAYFIRLFILFLEFLYKFNWYTTPLIVNLNDDFKPEQIEAIEEKFKNEREQLPLMVICTPYDSTISQWTKDPINPILPVIYGRILNLAKLSFELICQQISDSKSNFKDIFRTPIDIFDCKLFIKPEFIVNYPYQFNTSVLPVNSNAPKFIKNLHLICQPCSNKGKLKPSFPQVGHLYAKEYVEILKETFSNYALFFYNDYGGDMIGIVWKPEAFRPVPFDITKLKHHKISDLAASDGTLQMELNVEELLEEIELIGGEIIDGHIIRLT